MTEYPRATPSAVVIIETPESFLVEKRPDWPGRLINPNKIQLFGGHRESRESAEAAARRELEEELGLHTSEQLSPLWSGLAFGELRDRTPALRQVDLFHLWLATTAGIAMQIPGELALLNKTQCAVEGYRLQLTSFAHGALTSFIQGKYPVLPR